MKKIILTTPYPWIADRFVDDKKEDLKENEYLTTEKRIHKNWIEYIVYINKINCK